MTVNGFFWVREKEKKAEWHRRRIMTEENAKVVAHFWGDRIDSIPDRPSYFAPG